MLAGMKLLILLSVLFCPAVPRVSAALDAAQKTYPYEGERNAPPTETSKDKTPAKPKEKAGVTQTTEGTFLRVEEGDYTHWLMKNAQGREVSFFVLRPDAGVEKVLASPAKFVGKKCRVQWKSSTETIPEGGGRMKIEQILSVEWLGKK